MDLHLEPPHTAGPVRLGIGVEVHLEEDGPVTVVEFRWPGEGRTSTTRVLLGGGRRRGRGLLRLHAPLRRK
ncbi:hypothetical protein ACIGHB_09565 [Streptomyces sp. NPDC085460]|uniref:hypothetical protein n=1 Tax=Streptomyces sp. NPDC085460 TaxID=3365723 RepID=UPI0037D8DA8C